MQSCLICDDHALVRDALAMTVASGWPSAKIVQAEDFPTAWQKASEHLPDLIIADLSMPGADSLAGIAGLRTAAPKSLLLIVTGNYDDAGLLALLQMGIAGIVPKTAAAAIIDAAIHLVLAGGRYLPPRVAELAVAKGLQPPSTFLSPRQLSVVKLVAEGLSNKEIAQRLGLSPATVKTHVAQTIAALGALNRTDAAMRARSAGLL